MDTISMVIAYILYVYAMSMYTRSDISQGEKIVLLLLVLNYFMVVQYFKMSSLDSDLNMIKNTLRDTHVLCCLMKKQDLEDHQDLQDLQEDLEDTQEPNCDGCHTCES